MDVFSLNREEFKRSLELGYNINLEKYIKGVFPGMNPYEKNIFFLPKEVYDQYYFKTLKSEIINRDYNADILHEISHLIFDNYNATQVKGNKISLYEYFVNFDLLNSSTSTANGDIWKNFLSKLYQAKLVKEGDLTPLGMTKYSTYNN
jgi:hypothetical protein